MNASGLGGAGPRRAAADGLEGDLPGAVGRQLASRLSGCVPKGGGRLSPRQRTRQVENTCNRAPLWGDGNSPQMSLFMLVFMRMIGPLG
jgi:hypothetical protein